MKLLTSRYAQIGLAIIVAVLLIAAFSGSAAAAGPVYHTVLPGQTLYSIAMYYGTSVWAVACANGLYNPNYIYAGQVLLIPGGWDGGGCKPAHHPKPVYHPQPKPQPCCVQYQPQPCCVQYQPQPCCVQPQPPIYHPKPKPDHFGCYYTVRWGDDLYRIGLKYGISWVPLAHANGLHNANYIYAGQVLRVPCKVW